jgi:hypothetical protein
VRELVAGPTRNDDALKLGAEVILVDPIGGNGDQRRWIAHETLGGPTHSYPIPGGAHSVEQPDDRGRMSTPASPMLRSCVLCVDAPSQNE